MKYNHSNHYGGYRKHTRICHAAPVKRLMENNISYIDNDIIYRIHCKYPRITTL